MNARSRKSVRRASRLLPHDTSSTLGNPKLVFAALIECLQEGDYESAREVLAASLRRFNKAELERRYSIPRRTAYNLLDRKSLPTLELVAKVCQAIQQESLRK